jgi:GNAT superfamily N-acetyltransferase
MRCAEAGQPSPCHRERVIEIRELAPDELHLASGIDVTEDGWIVLEQDGAEIISRAEEWHRPPRSAERWSEFEAGWSAFIPTSGCALGAFDRDRLVGIATLRRGVRAGTDQLEALFVDRAHRRLGVAARAGGARLLYVSATPSESAVGVYTSRGFQPTTEPIPELLALEPDDIHMVLGL